MGTSIPRERGSVGGSSIPMDHDVELDTAKLLSPFQLGVHGDEKVLKPEIWGMVYPTSASSLMLGPCSVGKGL